ncbi:exopolysaccharide biosynthesis protein [Paucibacter sp. Y2R2-4]|uniref:exopolysaccharide biosynthesis protein n=1 Tax=Paucibacter sp. Y2R2-4 TaxID=2893553 RepID=UPI0021E4C26A|nr:exopolysaccharide biosynthesis protein [Paucibacter sp. Y2R2-4]MCV2350156.1 exopolysaccharide biosynthesis protein [Paucibacter sp. Y2R2-4]
MTQALSERLSRAAADLPPDSVTLQTLAAAHGPAAQGTLLILLSAPCVLPVPGVGSVLGWGLLAIAIALWRQDPLQLQSHAQLPTQVADIQLPRLWAERVLKLLARFYAAAGRMARTRLTHLTEGGAQRWLAAKVGLMAVLIVLPIPLGNLFPAISLMLVGMGLVARDGLAILAGSAMAAVSVLFSVAVLAAGWIWGLELWDLIANLPTQIMG